jgi:hypothetical protein
MQSPFELANINPASHFIIVNDFFVNELIGGAELTTAAIESSLVNAGYTVSKVKSAALTPQLISSNRKQLWIICNYSHADPRALSMLMRMARFVVIEYDFKFCSVRSPEKHFAETKIPCACASTDHGRFVTQFYNAAQAIIWMSEKQRDKTLAACKDMSPKQQYVASSVFDDKTLDRLRELHKSRQDSDKIPQKWLVFKSDSWIKGTSQSLQRAIASKLDYELIANLQYDEMLKKIASAEGIVYHPPGSDTCPRMIIEAAIIGTKIDCNHNVLHIDEAWAKLSSDEMIDALKKKRQDLVALLQEKQRPLISGYVTTLDCIKRKYPIIECINSLLRFCSEVIVMDGGSTDGTIELLKTKFSNKIKLLINKIDLSAPDFALEDGRQKARARAACTQTFCWQQDADEIVCERDVDDILHIAATMPEQVSVVCLPVVEFWGSVDKVRVDVTPWKWRLSRNDKNITHGIPKHLITIKGDNRQIAKHGTDGCDMIYADSLEPVTSISFMTQQAEFDRNLALHGDTNALSKYSTWFNTVISTIPCVFHVSWLDIERKLHLYKDYWTAHWASLYDEKPVNNFFNKDWSAVTDVEIKQLASQLAQIGGWIWHKPWDGTVTPSMKCKRVIPKEIMEMVR